MFKIKLPMPPSQNVAYRNVPRVGRVKTQQYKDFEKACQCIFQHNKNKLEAIKEQLKGKKIAIRMDFHFTRKEIFTLKNEIKKNDLLNRPKVLVDVLFKAIGIDDSQIWKSREEKIEDLESFVEVSLDRID
jgi:Holliday junction resolvase RusA-like endonuclease